MEVGEYYTWSHTPAPNVWIVDSIEGDDCMLKLISGSSCGFIMSRGLYPFFLSAISQNKEWVITTPKERIMVHKRIKRHTLC